MLSALVVKGSLMSSHNLPTSFKLFRDLNSDECHELHALMRPHAFRTGDLLVREGEHSDVVFFLEEGSVKVMPGRTDAEISNGTCSTPVVLSVVGRGSPVGELRAIDGIGHSYSVEALEPVRALALPIEDFWRCRRKMPDLSEAVIQHLAAMVRFQSKRQKILGLHNVSGALAAQLILFAEQCGEVQEDNSVLVPLPLNQTLLAALIGHARESVCKASGRFVQAGYIEKLPRHRILLKDLEALERVYQQAMPRR